MNMILYSKWKKHNQTRLWPNNVNTYLLTWNTYNHIKEVQISVWRYIWYVEYHYGRPGIKGQHKSSMFATLYSTKGTQINIQKSNGKDSKLISAQI